MKRNRLTAACLAAVVAATTLAPAQASWGKSFDAVYADASTELLRRNSSKGKNAMVSPLSAFTAISMAENGAKGKTLTEIENVFGGLKTKTVTTGLSGLSGRLTGNRSFKLKTPCSVWYRKNKVSLKPSYASKMRNAYDAEIRPANFDLGTVRDVNAWADKATNGKIKKIIDSISPSDLSILVSAAYFSGQWEDPYGGTAKRKFTCSDGAVRKVPMLESTEREYFEINGAKAFAKRYSGGKISFVAVLPPKGSSVRSFLSRTSGSVLMKAYRKRMKSGVLVDARLPKFKYSFNADLGKSLKDMGMKKAFTNGADFSAMANKAIHIDKIVHDSYIDVNEKGTEAAAVTTIVMKANSAFPPSTVKRKTVHLNRPFFYEIVETSTGLPLFTGIVENP